MYVNPFWFGVLMAIVGLIVLSIIWAIIRPSREQNSKLIEVEEEEAVRMFGDALKEFLRENPDILRGANEDEDDGK